MTEINVLLEGYKRFYTKHFLEEDKLYKQLATGQSPKTLVIACSDSRVDPTIITDANAGDIFVIRNVANLIPPYQPKGDSYHGTSAALEFAVNILKVENIVVVGHSGCAGIRALMESDNDPSKDNEFSFISSWVNIASDAKKRALKSTSNHDKNLLCEQEGIITSLQNLMTFPWINEKVKQKLITLHGWYFSLDNGKLAVYNPTTHEFRAIELEYSNS